ncbi:MAG: response regulator [Chitinivibrionales bacterium]|nr:response regulator [Chitinivibrionales bacterium]
MPDLPRILLIDDERAIRRILRLTLEANDFFVLEAPSAKDGLYQAASEHPDAIILDLGLPDGDGMDVLRQIREWSKIPVIILSVLDGEKEKVQALELGADDYVTKPFSVKELMARLHVALRHAQKSEEMQEFRNGYLTVDLTRRIVKKHEQTVKLTATEYALLVEFVKNAGGVLTHRNLMQAIWGPYRTSETETLRVHIAQLRKKLEIDPARPALLITESGVGYRMTMLD